MADRERPSRDGASFTPMGVLLVVLSLILLGGILCLIMAAGVLQVRRQRVAAATALTAAVHSGASSSASREESESEGSAETSLAQTAPGSRAVGDTSLPQAAPAGAAARAAATAAAPVDVPLTRALPGARASLLRVDDATRGSWIGHYGTLGYQLAMPGAPKLLPPDVRLTMHGGQLYEWSALTTDPRGLSLPGDPAHFSAGQWFSWEHFWIDLDLGRDRTCQVALYLLDWDSDARVQQMEVLDAEGAAVLLRRTDDHFGKGRYVALQLTGHVILRFRHTGGANTTLSGIFLDEPAPVAR